MAQQAPPPPAPGGPQIAVAQEGQLTIKLRERNADFFFVFRFELEQLGSGFSSPASVFLGIAFGVTLTLAVAAVTAQLGDYLPFFVIGAFAFGFLTLVLLVAYVLDLVKAARLVSTITKEDRKLPLR